MLVYRFLLSPGNPDSFTVGASHYWLGWYYQYRSSPPELDKALAHYTEVHRNHTCLVFIADSYYRVGSIYKDREMYDTALAYFNVRIPYIDYWERERFNALCSFAVAMQTHDITNAVRQIIRAERATPMARGHLDYNIPTWRQIVSAECGTASVQRISAWLDQQSSPAQYEWESVEKALRGRENAAANQGVRDMLLHAWPSLDDG